MAITAAQVKELRDRTGAGMTDCKKALEAVGGDLDKAAEKLRMDGAAKADKKASRTAAEGVIGIAQNAEAVALVEVNSETDFVAKGEDFRSLAKLAAELALKNRPANIEALTALTDGGESLDTKRRNLIAKIGENLTIRRFEIVNKAGSDLALYVHPGDKIAVAVAMDKGGAELGKDLAMHAAAMSPRFLHSDAVPADVIDAERKIIDAQIAQEQADDEAAGKKAKPADILAKMVDGKVRKFVAEITLLGQPFVKAESHGMKPDDSIEKVLKAKGAAVAHFARFAVGEGIEKQQTDFASEVMAQVGPKS
jgi:elongation factor Ts